MKPLPIPLPKRRGDKAPFPSGEGWGEALGLLRQSGDIDVWVEGGLGRIMKWVAEVSPSQEVNGHHIHFGYFLNSAAKKLAIE